MCTCRKQKYSFLWDRKVKLSLGKDEKTTQLLVVGIRFFIKLNHLLYYQVLGLIILL